MLTFNRGQQSPKILSPYLKKGRLAEVMAAIQVMAHIEVPNFTLPIGHKFSRERKNSVKVAKSRLKKDGKSYSTNTQSFSCFTFWPTETRLRFV